MKPTKTLIEAFRAVAEKMEINQGTWQWAGWLTCNCGLLARHLLAREGSGPGAIEDAILAVKDEGGRVMNWGHLAEMNCPLTGLPESRVFRVLAKHGLERGSYARIEQCGGGRRGTARDVAKQFRRWADELEEQRKRRNLVRCLHVGRGDPGLAGS